MDERRKAKRHHLEVDFSFTGGDFNGLTAHSFNVSSRGLYCVASRWIPAFTTLKVALSIPGDNKTKISMDCTGVVVRVEPEKELPGVENYNLAIFFIDLDKVKTAELEEILKNID